VTPVAAPFHGQHTHEVLKAELGYSDDQISDLAARGCFGTRPLPGIPMDAAHSTRENSA
jgi:hypothetical protein